MREIALLDATVLAPPLLRDLLLMLGQRDLYQTVIAHHSLDEVDALYARRNFGLTPAAIRDARADLEDAFESTIVRGYGVYEASVVDVPSRDTVAAAIQAHSTVIVTMNPSRYSRGTFAKFDIQVQHADEFLADQLSLAVDDVLAELVELAADGSMRPDDLLARLDVRLPRFAGVVRRELAARGEL